MVTSKINLSIKPNSQSIFDGESRESPSRQQHYLQDIVPKLELKVLHRIRIDEED